MEKEKKVLYSGMQATGTLTLGNYLGALKNWVSLCDDYECFYGVMDLHSLTVRQNPTEFRQNARKLYALYVAAGLDPEKNLLSVPCAGTCTVGMGSGLLYLYGRVEPYDPV